MQPAVMHPWQCKVICSPEKLQWEGLQAVHAINIKLHQSTSVLQATAVSPGNGQAEASLQTVQSINLNIVHNSQQQQQVTSALHGSLPHVQPGSNATLLHVVFPVLRKPLHEEGKDVNPR